MDKDREIRTLRNLLETMTEAESRAVAAYVPVVAENHRLVAENRTLRDRNAVLESALGDMCDAAREVLKIKPAT